MQGIDYLMAPDCNKFRIYLEYMSAEFKRRMSNHKKWRTSWKPTEDEVYLKFKNRKDDFEYFDWLCKYRKYEDIWSYFSSYIAFQDEDYVKHLGIFY